jgi:hypothetical protein
MRLILASPFFVANRNSGVTPRGVERIFELVGCSTQGSIFSALQYSADAILDKAVALDDCVGDPLIPLQEIACTPGCNTPLQREFDAGSIEVSEGNSSINVHFSDGSACSNQPTNAKKIIMCVVSNLLIALLYGPDSRFKFLKIRISIRFGFLTSNHQIYLRRSSESNRAE